MIVILSLILVIMALGLPFIIYIVYCLAHCCDPLPGSPAYAKRQVQNETRSNNREEEKVSSSDDPDDENLSKKKQPKFALIKKPNPKMETKKSSDADKDKEEDSNSDDVEVDSKKNK